MKNEDVKTATMADSSFIPALTFRIPMPPGAAVPSRQKNGIRLESVAASADYDILDDEE